MIYSGPNTKLLIHGNEDIGIVDSVSRVPIPSYGNARIGAGTKVITPYSDVKIKTDQYVFGGSSGYFDGIGDCLYLNDSEDWNFGAGDFSISVWYRSTRLTLANEWPGIVTHRYVSNSNHSWSLYAVQNNGGIGFSWTTTGSNIVSVNYTMSLSLNTWYYITVCRQGSRLFIGVNGSVIEFVTTASAYYNSTTTLSIGRLDTSGGNYLYGYLDELHISKGICRRMSNFIPPTIPTNADAYTVLLMHFNGVNNSTSFYDHSLRRSNFKEFLYFDGVGDCIRPYSSPDYTLGYEDFTIDCWVYLINGGHNGQAYGRIFETALYPTAGGIALVCENLVNPGRLLLHKSDGSTIIITDSALVNNTWYHVAIVRYKGIIKFYLNGIAQTTIYYAPLNLTTTVLSIGANLIGAESFYGFIDEFRVVKGTAVWLNNFLPPTEEYTLDIPYERRNMWVQDPYIYKATISGVNIYDLSSEILINYTSFSGGINSVWADDNYFYAATSISGIYKCSVEDIYGIPILEEYKSYPNITSNDVNYLHGKDDYLCIATISGIDRYKLSVGTREYIIKNNINKCFQTSNGDYYYTVNSFPNITNLDGNIFDWSYCRVVELSKPIPTADYQFLFEIPLTQPDEIYLQAKQNGDDIRIIEDNGVSAPYAIELWDNISPPKIWVRLSKDTQKFYIIYGNSSAQSLSIMCKVFNKFYDSFDEPYLSNKWIFDNGGVSNNTYGISNSKIRFNAYGNYTLGLNSVENFYTGMIEYNFRKVTGTSQDTDMDFKAGFLGSTMVYIGCLNNNVDEFPHYIDSASSSGIVRGTKLLDTSFKTNTIVRSLNYQMSDYAGETLVSSGTLLSTSYAPLRFEYSTQSDNSDIEIDWIRFRSYDPSPPEYIVGRGQDISGVFGTTELHIVYNDGGSHTYYSGKYDMIRASYISDLYVTEGTSTYGTGNVIFLATSYGATTIEEKRGDEENASKRVYLISTNREYFAPSSTFSAKSIIIDITDNWGDIYYVGLRSVELYLSSIKVSTPVATLTGYDTTYEFDPKYAFMDEVNKIGIAGTENGWASYLYSVTNQRIICVFSSPIVFDAMIINNYHHYGTKTNVGAKNINVYSSLNTITDPTYGLNTENFTLLFTGQLHIHSSADAIDNQALVLTNI